MQIVGAIAFCIVFGLPFWRASNEPTKIGSPQCGVMKDNLERLACFDAASQRVSVKDATHMTFGEMLSGLHRGGDEWAPRK